MTRFMKLTQMILNFNDISKIIIHPKKYTLYLKCQETDGFVLLVCGSGFGTTSSFTQKIEVCAEKNSIDYQIITNWIKYTF